jgi:peptidyl-prolyl cis-trans isomerase B (cyclophilin B)
MNKNLRRIILAVSAMSLTLVMGCSSSEPTNQPLDPPKELPIATIEIKDYGTIEAELYPHLAPNTVNNFIELSNNNFYNGLIIHRVVKDFVLQGGDPEGTGMGGPGYGIKGEFSENGVENNISHVRGIVSMARSMSPNSAGSQFFIVTDDSVFLDGKYAAFGSVIEGMTVVDKIVKSRVITRSPYGGGKDRPVEPPVMKTVTVETFGVEYPEPEKA